MRELRRRAACSFEDKNVLESIRKMVLPANDMRDTQIGVIGTRGEVIGGHPIGAEQGKIFNVRGGLHLFAVDRIGKAHDLAAFAGHAKPQGERLSGRGTAVALGT
jgi:hypothetical protein